MRWLSLATAGIVVSGGVVLPAVGAYASTAQQGQSAAAARDCGRRCDPSIGTSWRGSGNQNVSSVRSPGIQRGAQQALVTIGWRNKLQSSICWKKRGTCRVWQRIRRD